MDSGNLAERAVANHLTQQGYKIIALNWRNKYVEVDIIAQKSGVVYFIESKYRSNTMFGDGTDYINKAKLSKMQLGAELWVEQNNWNGDYQLLAVSISGPNFEHIELFEILD